MNLNKLNSITKYPSILTYHELGEMGRLRETLTADFSGNEFLEMYEKIDGTNSRIILFISEGIVRDYFIGSREELLFAKNDRIIHQEQGIVETLLPVCEKIVNNVGGTEEGVYVIFSEAYGGRLPASKNYTNNKIMSSRTFDVIRFSYKEFEELYKKEPSAIASWREHGGQPFLSSAEKESLTKQFGLEVVPNLGTTPVNTFPKDIQGVYNFLLQFETTRAAINTEGRAEGIIVRSTDRKQIAKIRFEDYERTLGIKRKK